MKTKDKMKELRASAYDAGLTLSKANAATWKAASDYCECTRKVFEASKYSDDKATGDTDWDSYLDAMQVLSSAKDIAQETDHY